MIRVNLLKSVTDRQDGAVSAVERQVSSPALRFLVMGLVVGFLTLAFVGWDIIGSEMAKAAAQTQLDEQKEIAAKLEVIIKEQADLEMKIKNIDLRIEAIKKLRANQAGPSAVLNALTERMSGLGGLYLEQVDQKGDQLVITGNSPNEALVTQFGRSLEFSNGLFSNLNIEIAREELKADQVNVPDGGKAKGSFGGGDGGGERPKVETVNFTIRCAYTPSKAPQADGTQLAAGQGEQPQAAAPEKKNNKQVAKN